MRPGPRNLSFLGRVDWSAVVTWGLGFGLIAFLGIEGGGFDQLVYEQAGIAIWWVVLVGVVVGALPVLGPGRTATVGLALFAAFVAWTALSLLWTESSERTLTDLSRVLTYLGVFVLAIFLRVSSEPRRLIAALAAAIAVIGLLGLLSRLHPDWFPSAQQTALFLEDASERLSYPLDYWNGLGALIAIGLPLLLQISVAARSLIVRALAVAAMPALALALFFTLSRAGIGAAALALIAFLCFARDRAPKIVTLAIVGAAAGLLIALASQRDALRQGLDNATAQSQGDEMLAIVLCVGAAAALVQALVSRSLLEGRRPRWLSPDRRGSLALLGGLVAVVLVLAAAFDAPSRVDSGLDEFRSGSNAGTGTARLNSFAGASRYALWRSAIDENATAPLTGTGSGTFVYWWDRDAAGAEAVQDAHSLYLQTLGELGLIGFLLLLAFVALVMIAGGLATLRAGPERSHLAAALAGCLAFFLAAAVDWGWQMPVLATIALILAATLLTGAGGREGPGPLGRWPGRLGVAVVALVAIVAIAVPLASTGLVRSSQSEVRDGELDAALADARSARNVEPWAATPRLQEALVLELQGDLDAAAESARAATERESTNWRTWLVLSRIEAKRGDADASIAAYREARSLKPLSPLFERETDG